MNNENACVMGLKPHYPNVNEFPPDLGVFRFGLVIQHIIAINQNFKILDPDLGSDSSLPTHKSPCSSDMKVWFWPVSRPKLMQENSDIGNKYGSTGSGTPIYEIRFHQFLDMMPRFCSTCNSTSLTIQLVFFFCRILVKIR